MKECISKKVEIENGVISAVIDSFGAELRSLIIDGEEILWDGNPSVWSGQAPLLFPICGGLKEDKFTYEGKEYTLPKHGFARKSDFLVESTQKDSVTFLLCPNDETKKNFPFEYELRVIYELCDNRLNVTYSIKNTDQKDIYFSIGAHEAYACKGGIEGFSVVFDKTENLNTIKIEDGILSYKKETIKENCTELALFDNLFVDDALVFDDLKSRKLWVKNNRTDRKIGVEFDGFDYLLIWTKPGAEYICIEPWCGIPDYPDGNYDITKKQGIIHLEKGREKLLRHTLVL